MVIHVYGLLIGIGIYLGIILAEQAKLRLSSTNPEYTQVNPDHLLWWMFLPALIGARLYHVIDLWSYYQFDPVKILFIWQGGLAIYGALLGGLLGLLLYLLKSKQLDKTLYFTDILVLVILVGQIVGRIGNYFNHELFGLPTKLPWGIYIPGQFRPATFIQYSYFHPLFLYESLLNLLVLVAVWKMIKSVKTVGIITGVYCLSYGFIRFSLDFLRIDPWRLGFFTTAQWLSLVVIILGLGLLLRKQ